MRMDDLIEAIRERLPVATHAGALKERSLVIATMRGSGEIVIDG